MPRSSRAEVFRSEGYEVRVVGGPAPGLRDLYHSLLRMSWWTALGVIVGTYLALNAVFALVYLAAGGVANAAPGSFADAFFFSIQTMGTIGYGSMYPATRFANVVVVAESVTGLVVTALATGLVFVRFSQTRARIVFSSRVAVGPMDGVETLMVRLGNERSGRIVGAHFRLTLVRTTRTAEGVLVYRNEDLPLVRDRADALARSWMVLHRIGPGSPLANDSADTLAACEAELTLSVAGTDETSMQAALAQHTWMHHSIAWNARLADVLTETPDGNLLLDLSRFHDVVPADGSPSPPPAPSPSPSLHPSPSPPLRPHPSPSPPLRGGEGRGEGDGEDAG